MEDDPAEVLVNSTEHDDLEKIQIPTKSSALSTMYRTEYPRPRLSNGLLSEKAICLGGNHSREDASVNLEGRKTGKRLFKEEELLSTSCSMDNLRSNGTTSTSRQTELPAESVVPHSNADMEVVNNGKGVINANVSGNLTEPKFSKSPLSDGLEEFCDGMSPQNPENEVMIFRDCDSTSGLCSGSGRSDSPLCNTCVLPSSSGIGSRTEDGEEDHRDANELQIDMANVSSNILSNSSFGPTRHEARRNSRRIFWDSFSQRYLRRNANSRTFLYASDDAEGLGAHDGLPVESNGDIFGEEVGGHSRSYSSNQSTNEQQWHSSSEIIRGRSGNSDNENNLRAAFCPSGIHPEGTCACGSILTAEESGARASISRIVMLAEALFEVLDEVHRQPLSLSLSTVSLPAPESVVDSLPVKSYSKQERKEGSDGFAQCYICLAEYNEGDKIRVLPCQHDFHVPCIDKWLKEIHGVCPLCRGDVREGSSSGSVSL